LEWSRQKYEKDKGIEEIRREVTIVRTNQRNGKGIRDKGEKRDKGTEGIKGGENESVEYKMCCL
jgi:hypothetical protein